MSIYKSTFRHAIVYSIAAVIGKAIGFLLLPFYAYYIGTEGYGIIGMLDTTMGFFSNLLGFGLVGTITRFYHDEKDQKNKNKVISTGVILIWVTAGSISFLLMMISPFISHILIGDASKYKIVCFALATFVFDLTRQSSSSYLLIRQFSFIFSILSISSLSIGLFLNIYLIFILEMGVEGLFLSNLITSFLSSIIFNSIMIYNCGISADINIVKKLISFEGPQIPANIISFFSYQIERILLRYMVSLNSVGILEMGCKFPSLLPMIISEPFMQSWHTKRTEIATSEGGPKQIGQMFTFFLFIYLFAGLILFVNIREIITLMLPREFWPSYIIARVEFLTVLFMTCYYHLFFGLYYTKNTKKIALIKIVVSIIKIPISFVLILWFGLNGAAYAAAVTSCIMMSWAAFLSQQAFPIEIELKKISTLLVIAICLAVFLSNIQSNSFAFIQQINAVVKPLFIEFFDFDFLHTWKSGLVLKKLDESSELIILIGFKTLICLSFTAFLPIVHEGMRKWLYKRFCFSTIATK